jgi:Zn-dependent alcohol dehydrogenase
MRIAAAVAREKGQPFSIEQPELEAPRPHEALGDSVPDAFIPRLLDLFLEGRFPLDRLVTYYALDRINEAITDMKSGKAIKPVMWVSRS